MSKRMDLSAPHHSVFNYETASVAEVATEAARRQALRGQGVASFVRVGRVDSQATVDITTANLGEPLTITMPAPRLKMNKTEARYAELLRGDPAIQWYAFESITLKLGDGVRYTPDFFAIRYHSTPLEIHEVKGPYIRDDARVKLRVAATLFPMFRFKLCQWKDKQWTITNIDPR